MMRFSSRLLLISPLFLFSLSASADCGMAFCGPQEFNVPVFITNTTENSPALTVTGGNTGIGTTNPLAPLHSIGLNLIDRYGTVASTIHLRSAAGTQSSPTVLPEFGRAGVLLFSGFDGAQFRQVAQVHAASADTGGLTSTSSAGVLVFSTTPVGSTTLTEKMRITSAGRVGIGTNNPSEKLEVVGNVKADGICIGTDCRTSWPEGGSTGVIPIAEGGTGQTTAAAALNALLPDQTSNSGKVLKTNGTTASWQEDGSGSGSVTSVDVSVPSYMSASGGPITSTGTIALSFSSQSEKTFFAGPASGSGAPSFRNLQSSDIRSSVAGAWWNVGGACSAGQSLQYSAVSDQVSCASYSITSSQVTTALGFTPVSGSGFVAKAGDSMTGTLNLPSNGLAVGTSQLVVSDGNVGVGTATPARLLHVAGPMRIAASTAPSTPAAGDLYIDSADSNKLKWYDGSAWQTPGSGGGGSGTPAGSNSQVQFNNSGAFGANANFVWDNTNGRLGVGASSPNTRLHVYGSGDSVATVQTTSGSGSSAALRLLGAATNADWHVLTNRGDLTGTADSLGFYKTSGSSGTKMVIQNNGHVGIGTNSPARLLHVADAMRLGPTTTPSSPAAGDIFIDSAASNALKYYNGSAWVSLNSGGGGGSGDLVNGGNTVSATMTVGTNSAHDLAFETGGSTRMTVTSGGNIGVGITNPTAGFEMNYGTGTGRGFYLYNSTGASANNPLATIYSGNAAFDQAGLDVTYNGTSEAVGIYNSGTSAGLYIGQQTTATGLGLNVYSNTGATQNAPLAQFTANNAAFDTTVMYVQNYGTGASFRVDDQSSDTSPFVIDASGNVGIGTATPAVLLDVRDGDLHVRGNGTQFKIKSSGGGDRATLGNNGGSNGILGLFNSSDVKTIEISGAGASYLNSGNVGIGNTSPSYPLDVTGAINSSSAIRVAGVQVCTSSGCTSSSDERLKQNIQPLQGSLAKILSLQGVSYDWKNKELYGEGNQIGLIAQELEKVFPEMVRIDAQSGMRSVTYDHLVAPLIEAVKELNHENQTLRSRLDAIEARLAEMSEKKN